MQTDSPGARSRVLRRREPEAPWGFLPASGDKDLGFHKGIHRATGASGAGSAGNQVEQQGEPSAPLSRGRPGLFIRDEKNVLSLNRNAWQGNSPWKHIKWLPEEPVWVGKRAESPTWASHTGWSRVVGTLVKDSCPLF